MGRYADFQSTIIPNGIDGTYWRANPSSQVSPAGDAQPRLSRQARAAQRPGGRDRSFAKIAQALPDVRLLMAGDGPMRAELEAQVPGASARARGIPRRRLRSTPRAARFVVVVPPPGARGGVLHHGAGGLRGGSAGGRAPGAGRRSGRRALGNVVMAKDNSSGAFADAVDRYASARPGRAHRPRAVIADAFDWEKVGGRILDVFERVAGTARDRAGLRPKAAA